MDIDDYLTNEKISKRFESQFDLVNYAIKIAGDMIHAGRGPRVKTDTENTALQVLEEILQGKDRYKTEEFNSANEETFTKEEAFVEEMNEEVTFLSETTQEDNNSSEEDGEKEHILAE